MKAVDLFAGCGGLSLGLEQAGFGQSIAVEKSDMAAETHYRNFHRRGKRWSVKDWQAFLDWDLARQARDAGTVVADIWDIVGDPAANQVGTGKLTPVMQEFQSFAPDLVAGGPPCQGFSMAGQRDPEDLRNELPWAFLEFVRLTAPRAVVIENVVGINRAFRRAGSAAPFEQLRQALQITGSGYVVQPVELNAKHYGVPQNRPRMMLLGLERSIAEALDIDVELAEPWRSETAVTGRGTNPPSSRLVPEPSHPDGWISAGEALADLGEHGYLLSGDASAYEQSGLGYAAQMRLDSRGAIQSRPVNHVKRNHTKRVRERFILYGYLRDWGIPSSILGIPDKAGSRLEARVQIDAMLDGRQCPVDLGKPGEDLVDVVMRLRTRKHSQRAILAAAPAPTVVTLPDDCVHPSEPRTLTVRELARFQSFPDWFEFRSKETTGSHRRRVEVPQYSQVGNAVPPLLGYAVGKTIKALLDEYDERASEPRAEYEFELVGANAR